MSNYLHILGALENRPWAITPEMLQTMLEIVYDEDPSRHQAVAAKMGRPLDNTGGRVEMRGSIAVMELNGPIFRYANLMTELSGATSIQTYAKAFDTAVNNAFVEQIVLHINSPGGEFDGINSFADQVREAVAKKPVYAFIDGIGASAAYWIASASSQIWSDESSWIGSIGVVANISDKSAADEKRGVRNYKIVSSQSPRKQPSPSTEAGLQQIQAMIDEAAALFISRVAQFRGVSEAKVAADFGGGAVLTPKPALAAGMIDGIDSFEAFMRSLEAAAQIHYLPAVVTTALEGLAMSPNSSANASPLLTTGGVVSLPATSVITTGGQPPIVVNTSPPEPDPKDVERQRIRMILTSAQAQDREALARHVALETDLDVADALALLGAAPKAPANPEPAGATAFERHMARVPNPKVGAGSEALDDDSPQAEVQRILAQVPKKRLITAGGVLNGN